MQVAGSRHNPHGFHAGFAAAPSGETPLHVRSGFDLKVGYRTSSRSRLPLISAEEDVIGVIS